MNTSKSPAIFDPVRAKKRYKEDHEFKELSPFQSNMFSLISAQIAFICSKEAKERLDMLGARSFKDTHRKLIIKGHRGCGHTKVGEYLQAGYLNMSAVSAFIYFDLAHCADSLENLLTQVHRYFNQDLSKVVFYLDNFSYSQGACQAFIENTDAFLYVLVG